MFYATYKGIGESDIAEFEKKEDRDAWVSFNDAFSISHGVTSDNATFQRKNLSESTAKRKIRNRLHTQDKSNSGLKWYICGQ